MKFYDVDNALQEAINAADKPVRLKIEIEMNGHFQSVFEQDIIEANFYSHKEASGGVTTRGDVLIDNSCGFFSNFKNTAGLKVKVSFSIGEGLPFFNRFIFYINDKGIQDIKGNGRKKCVKLGLRDLSLKLKKSDEARDWTAPAVFTYSVVCDKTQSEKSLVHGIAKRAGLTADDIDCSTIPVTLPYVRLKKNIWTELSNLAKAYRCHLECAVEKPLVFAHSPYQTEPLEDNDYSYTFNGSDIFYLDKYEHWEYYSNSIRLKLNMPVSLEKQEIWRYNEPPVFYDDFMQPHYPFKFPLQREIEISKYEAKYKIIETDSKERNVLYADDIDTQEEAENRLEYDGGSFSYSLYDVTTNPDRAILTLQKENDSDLYKASIHGRPIVQDLNRSCFMRDDLQILKKGTRVLNITGSYFSDYEIDGVKHYEDWVKRELAERIKDNRVFITKTHKAVFNTRVGANVKIEMKDEVLTGKITAFIFRYKRNKAFVSFFRIIENKGDQKNEE